MTYPLPILQTIALSYRVFWLGLGKFIALFLLILLASLIVIVPVVGAKLAGVSTGTAVAIQLVTTLIQIILQTIAQMAMYVIAARIIEGQDCGIGEAMSQTSGRFLTVLGVILIQVIAVTLGMVLLVIPGIILALMLAVAVPVTLLEGLSVGESLSRSRVLTDGQKWRIFGLALTVMLTAVVILLVVGVVMGLALPKEVGGIVVGLVALLMMLAFIPLGVTLAPVLYMQLRSLHDGHAAIG